MYLCMHVCLELFVRSRTWAKMAHYRHNFSSFFCYSHYLITVLLNLSIAYFPYTASNTIWRTVGSSKFILINAFPNDHSFEIVEGKTLILCASACINARHFVCQGFKTALIGSSLKCQLYSSMNPVTDYSLAPGNATEHCYVLTAGMVWYLAIKFNAAVLHLSLL